MTFFSFMGSKLHAHLKIEVHVSCHDNVLLSNAGNFQLQGIIEHTLCTVY